MSEEKTLEDMFGSCPECEGFLDSKPCRLIDYKSHQWMACDEHKVVWFLGNPLGGETDTEDALEVLNNYRYLNPGSEAEMVSQTSEENDKAVIRVFNRGVGEAYLSHTDPTAVYDTEDGKDDESYIKIEIPAEVSHSEAVEHFELVLAQIKGKQTRYEEAQRKALALNYEDVREADEAVRKADASVRDAKKSLYIAMDKHVHGGFEGPDALSF